MTISDPVIVSAFGTAFAALAAVIRIMWAKLSADHRALRARSEECEADRRKLWQRIAEIVSNTPLVESCPRSDCPMKPDSAPDTQARRKTTRIIPRPLPGTA